DYYRKTGEKEKVFEELKLGFGNSNLDIDTKINILLSFYTINEIVTDLKEQAFELAELLVATHPDDPKAYSIHGDLLAQDEQFEQARDAFLRVISMDSSKFVVWEEILRMDLLMNDYDHLSTYGHRAIELYPEQPVLYLFTALGEMQVKNYTEAEKLLNRGVKLVVSNNEILSQYYMYLGDTYHALNRPAESDKAYEKSLQIKENSPYVLNNYSYYLAIRGKELEKAEQMSKKALDSDPNNSSFQDTYGWVLFKLGKYENALEWIGKSMQDKENISGEVLEHYGDVLFKLGRESEAMDYWKQALEKGNGSELLPKKISGKKWIEE
ncbi:MAG: tetratricopeptide repeat protein, partial [Bacteroidales bacterium]|nr:tetratricopeptide repeat protein [Bacteroidales bacterium]